MLSKSGINEKKNAPPNITSYENGNKITSFIIYNFRKLIKVRKNRFKSIDLYKRAIVRKFINIKFLIKVLKNIFGFVVRNIKVILHRNI